MLELPQAWEPVDRRLACRIGEGTSFLCHVFSQNMDRQSKARISIFWKVDFDLKVETFSKYHIDTTINKNKEDE